MLMKKIIILCVAVLALFVALIGCDKISDTRIMLDDIGALSDKVTGITQNEVHELLGSPAGKLSGFWGDMYYNSDDQAVIIYYDADGKVELVKIAEVSAE